MLTLAGRHYLGPGVKLVSELQQAYDQLGQKEIMDVLKYEITYKVGNDIPINPEWIKEHVTPAQYGQLESRAIKNHYENDKEKYHQGLTFGQTIALVKKEISKQIQKCTPCNGKGKVAGKDCTECGGDGITKASILYPYFTEKSLHGFPGASDKVKVNLIKGALDEITRWRTMGEYGEEAEKQKAGDKKLFEDFFEKITGCVDDGIKLFEPRGALEAGSDGLDAYREIAFITSKMMHSNSFIFLEIGMNQKNDVIGIFNDYNILIFASARHQLLLIYLKNIITR